MRKIGLLFIALFGVLVPRVSAQDQELMADYQSQLQSIFEEVYNAPTDNQRYHANEAALQLFTEA